MVVQFQDLIPRAIVMASKRKRKMFVDLLGLPPEPPDASQKELYKEQHRRLLWENAASMNFQVKEAQEKTCKELTLINNLVMMSALLSTKFSTPEALAQTHDQYGELKKLLTSLGLAHYMPTSDPTLDLLMVMRMKIEQSLREIRDRVMEAVDTSYTHHCLRTYPNSAWGDSATWQEDLNDVPHPHKKRPESSTRQRTHPRIESTHVTTAVNHPDTSGHATGDYVFTMPLQPLQPQGRDDYSMLETPPSVI